MAELKQKAPLAVTSLFLAMVLTFALDVIGIWPLRHTETAMNGALALGESAASASNVVRSSAMTFAFEATFHVVVIWMVCFVFGLFLRSLSRN